MVKVIETDLRGKIANFGPVRFVSAQWWQEASRFVLLRYTVYGALSDAGIRMDLDKQAILDDLDDAEISIDVRNSSRAIWNSIINESDFLENVRKVSSDRVESTLAVSGTLGAVGLTRTESTTSTTRATIAKTY